MFEAEDGRRVLAIRNPHGLGGDEFKGDLEGISLGPEAMAEFDPDGANGTDGCFYMTHEEFLG